MEASPAPRAPLAMTRLGVMMFLEFFLWGSWMVPMGKYLTALFAGREDIGSIIGNAYGTGSLAAIIAPLLVGLVADRFLPGQVVLGVLHIVGAGLLYGVARATDPTTFYWTLLAAGLCFMPTLALVNSVSFDHLAEPQRQFPLVRVWGTIGWIVAGVTVGSLLPRMLGLDAIGLLKSPAFAVFAIASFLVCIPLAVYYAKANEYISDMGIAGMVGLGSETVMTFGQMSEIGFMLLMPFFLARFGVKTMLIGGMAAWAARYALFAFGAGSAWMLILAVVLHGICYDFFFVTGQLYTDHVAPRELRASAQGLIALLTYGAGMYVGNLAFPKIAAGLTDATGAFPWRPFWLTFALMAVAVMVAFAVAFRELVVIAIIAALAGILVPAVQSARESSRRSLCGNNLKQQGIALHGFHDTKQKLPSGGRPPDASTIRCGVFVYMLPWLDQNSLWQSYDTSVTWSDPKNTQVTSVRIPTFECPSSPRHSNQLDQNPDGTTGFGTGIVAVGDYAASLGIDPRLPGAVTGTVVISGSTFNRTDLIIPSVSMTSSSTGGFTNGMLPKNASITFQDVTDGLSNTIAVFESGGRPYVYQRGVQKSAQLSTAHTNAGGWCRPASDILFAGSSADGKTIPGAFINRTNGYDHGSEAYGGSGYPAPYGTEGSSQPYAFHPGGLHVLVGDGAVKFIDENIGIEVLSALITRNQSGKERKATFGGL